MTEERSSVLIVKFHPRDPFRGLGLKNTNSRECGKLTDASARLEPTHNRDGIRDCVLSFSTSLARRFVKNVLLGTFDVSIKSMRVRA